MIELKNINKNFIINKKTVHALQDVNLCIKRGEIFGILGESGAGKSTLLRTVNLLERPTSGQVLVDNVNLTAISDHSLMVQRKNIGMIFQHFNLLQSRNVYENIALPLELMGEAKQVIQQKVNSLLELVHLTDHQYHFPQQLSGGQKQRVAIARALATQPHILLCDEATSALDPNTTASILNLLQEINQKLGVTILLITHEMDVIKQICHRAGVMDQGKLIECGNLIELFAKPKSPVTQKLVQKALHLELPATIKNKLQAEFQHDKSHLVRFTFIGDDSSEPLISTLVTRFKLVINIIQANIENIQDTTVGFTICQLNGNADDIAQALAYIKTTSITAEVLGYV